MLIFSTKRDWASHHTELPCKQFSKMETDLEFYQGVLHDLEKGTYSLPPKTRDIFLFCHMKSKNFSDHLSFSSGTCFPSGQAGLNNGVREPPMKILKMEEEGFSTILMKVFALIKTESSS